MQVSGWRLLPLLAFLTLTNAQATSSAHWLDSYKDDTELFTIDGYRLLRYRAPTPATAEGAVTLSTEQLRSMLQQSAPPSLIDVQPIPWKAGRFIIKDPREHIPGSQWLPNVGQGEPEAQWQDYFVRELQRISQENADHPMVFYCRADCWMSWNAVKRAHHMGYRALYWYRAGTDGWREAGLPMEQATPIPWP